MCSVFKHDKVGSIPFSILVVTLQAAISGYFFPFWQRAVLDSF